MKHNHKNLRRLVAGMMTICLLGISLTACGLPKLSGEQAGLQETQTEETKDPKAIGIQLAETQPEEDVRETADAAPTIKVEEEGTAARDVANVNADDQKDQWPLASNQAGYRALKETLEGMIEGYAGDWSLAVWDLETGDYLEINSHRMKAASLTKLFIMGTVYHEIAEGRLEKTEEIDRLLEQMITVSDNESSNELVRLLTPSHLHEDGMKVVNAYTRDRGYLITNQGRDMRDFRTEPAPGENYTCVRECAMFWKAIYDGRVVSPEASKEMLGRLQRQTRTWKLPAGIPSGVKTANKTGELPDTENDTAIVFGHEAGLHDYLVCVMSSELTDTGTAQQEIVQLSQTIWHWYENEYNK